MNNDRICGKCKYHKYHRNEVRSVYGDNYDSTGEWYCDCMDSEFCGCETEYEDYCEDFEER